MSQSEASRVIQICEEREEFIQLEDGFYYYAPATHGGCLSPHNLRTIADELDRRNEPLRQELETYFAAQETNP